MKTQILFLSCLVYFSCSRGQADKWHYSYLKNSELSDSAGMPIDSLTFYFPSCIQKDSVIETGLDTFELNWYSSALYSFREPLLYNYYLGHDVYRFLWLRSFHRPMVFSLHKEKKNVWLITKELDKQSAFIIFNQTTQLSLKEWREFESLLAQCSFWTMPPSKINSGKDGSEWIIEGHLCHRYWLVNRWSPKDDFALVGKYLIEKSGVDEEIY
jgi:hypothetical protein